MEVMGTTNPLMTFEEFERLPDEPCKLQLIDGEVLRLPPAKIGHVRIRHRLFEVLEDALSELHNQGKGSDLGEVFMRMGYRFGDNWLIPDVSVSHAGQPENDYLEGAPALAVEVMSESNTAPMMHRKTRKYLENGAREVWLVYPETASVVVCRGKTAIEVEGTLATELLPGVTIDLASVFGSPEKLRP